MFGPFFSRVIDRNHVPPLLRFTALPLREPCLLLSPLESALTCNRAPSPLESALTQTARGLGSSSSSQLRTSPATTLRHATYKSFRITSFAAPYSLSPLFAHLCRKHRGWGSAKWQILFPLPLFCFGGLFPFGAADKPQRLGGAPVCRDCPTPLNLKRKRRAKG